jgi:acylphosphatase
MNRGTVRLRILVSGLVQGVGFRYSTVELGQRLGLRGWARNLPDGRVEVVAEGSEEGVHRLARWCRQGPPAARVSDVEEEPVDGGEPLGEFGVRW